MPPFPRENRRSFRKRAANFAQGLFGRFRPKSLTNALNYGATENAKKNTTRRVPKVGFGPGGPIHSLNGEYVSPELEDSLKLTRNADIREQNRFRRVLALLDEKNFESFFGFSDMDVEQDPRKRSPPRVIVEDYERLLTTRKRYGNNNDESEDEIIEAYNDLLFMILQLLFLVCFYLLNDLKREIHKILTRINPEINPTEREKLEELYKKIKNTIDKAEEITKFYSRVKDAINADINKIFIAFISFTIGATTSAAIVISSGALLPAILAVSFGLGPLALVKFFFKKEKVEGTRDLQFYMYIKALRKLFQVVFNPKNIFSFKNLVEKNKINWGVFNRAQIEFIIERGIPLKEIDKEPNCPQCLDCMNEKNYYDMDPPKTKKNIKNINSLSDDKYFEKYEECESMPAEQLLCAHRFHTRCINKWINSEMLSGRDAPCPICRAPILKYADYNYANKSFDLDPASPIGDKLITHFVVEGNISEERRVIYKLPTTIPVRKTAALKEWTKEGPKEGAEEIMENSSKKFTGGMTDVMFLNFLTHLLNLYYEPGKIRVFNSEVPIEELGKTPNKPPLIARPFTHKPKSANNVTRRSVTGEENEEGTFAKFGNSKGFGSNNMNVKTNPALSLRAPEGGKRRSRKYKKAH